MGKTKVSDMIEWRDQGLGLGYKIAKEAQAAGKDPVKAISDEIQNRRNCSISALVTKAEWQHDHDAAFRYTFKMGLIIAMATLWGEFKFGGVKRLPAFVDEYVHYVIEIGKGEEAGGTSIEELVRTLRENVGADIDITADDLIVDFRKANASTKLNMGDK